MDAYGVDLSEDFVDQCLTRVASRSYWPTSATIWKVSAERSLSVVTAFHLVEHIPVDRLIHLLDLSVRALEPGGLLILETPNPENLVVGASSFYIDPSHLRPLPPGLLAFLVEARGFARVETRFLHPDTAATLQSPKDSSAWSADLAPLVELINNRLYGPRDYAVIGRRL